MSTKKGTEINVVEIICSVCGKSFIPAPLHAYKDKRTYQTHKRVCSWKCVCESERQRDAAKKSKAKKG